MKIGKNEKVRGAAIAQWICQCIPSCCPRFEIQPHHLCFHKFIELCNVEKMKINKKRPGLAHFLENSFFLKNENLKLEASNRFLITLFLSSNWTLWLERKNGFERVTSKQKVLRMQITIKIAQYFGQKKKCKGWVASALAFDSNGASSNPANFCAINFCSHVLSCRLRREKEELNGPFEL